MVQGHAVLEVADRVLDLGVAVVVGLELERRTIAVGDVRVIVVQDERRKLEARGRLHPAGDRPDRERVGPVGKGDIHCLGQVGATVEPIRDRRPGRLWDRLDQAVDRVNLADRYAEADLPRAATLTTADVYRVGPDRSSPVAPGSADPCDRLGQQVGGASRRFGAALAEARHPGGDREERVIAPVVGVAVGPHPPARPGQSRAALPVVGGGAPVPARGRSRSKLNLTICETYALK